MVGNLVSQAYDKCYSGVSDLSWSQAAMAGALGVVNVRPGAKLFNHDSSTGNIENQVMNE